MAPTFPIANARRSDAQCDDFAAHDPSKIPLNHTENRIRASLPAPAAANREAIRRRLGCAGGGIERK